MPLRLLLISLLAVRAMLGSACGQIRPVESPAGECCCCVDTESCGEPTLGCTLCAACAGRVPSLPPVVILIDTDWRAIIDEPMPPLPAWPRASMPAPAIVASQIVSTVPWCERLRPTICIWTI